MTEDSLDGLVFSSGSEERTAGEFIDTIHDEDILYYYIQDAYEKTKSGIQINADGKEEKINTHAQVEVFQSTIQYVEAFGIYLLSYIKGKENLVDNLVETRPKHLRRFFESLQDGEEDEYLQNQGIDEDYEAVLESLFGYAFIDEVGEEVSEEELREAIDQSIEVLDANIRRIGEFYLYFHDIYNAVKHGNRALPQLENGFKISRENEEDTELEVDLNFVLFLCRTQDWKPFLAGVPIDYLIDHSLKIAGKTHRVFSYLKKVSRAETSGEEIDLSFFRFEEADNEDEQEWITATSKSGVIILPKIEELEELQQPQEVKFPGRIELDHRTLYIKTQYDEETSEEYPLEVTTLQRGVVGLTPQPLLGVNFNFVVDELDVDQYFEYLNLQELELDGEGIDRIIIVDEQADQEIDTGTPENFDIPEELDYFLEWEELEQLYWLQQISGERIPIPLNVAKEQGDIINECIESDLEQDDAVAAVEELKTVGEKNHWTTVHVDLVTLDGRTLQSEPVCQIQGELIPDIEFYEDEHTEQFEEEWGDPGKDLQVVARGYEGGYEDLVEALGDDSSKVEEILGQLDLGADGPTPPKLVLHYEIGEPGFWFTEHTLRFQFLTNQIRINVKQSCPLCGNTIATDLRTHLVDDCNPSI